MKSSCPKCEKTFTYDESRFGGRPTVRVRCPSCKATISLTNPDFMAETIPAPAAAVPPPETTAKAAVQAEEPGAPAEEKEPPTIKVRRQTLAAVEGREQEEIPPMPADRRVSLAILSGKDSGQVISCTRSRVVMGRVGTDVPIDDDEVSRAHALLEIHEDRYVLKDLGSTNGTFVDERRISETEIADRGEFRIGNTQLMLIVTPIEDL